ncbi:MAG: exo-alpha-sialidase [Deltaproteobacteria bacterium]
MGQRAHRQLQRAIAPNARGGGSCDDTTDGCDEGGFVDPDGDLDGANGGNQAETTLAVDDSGQHIVIGFNDTRGFAKNPISVSGFMYSDDGGRTFTDGGQLPSPANDVVGTTLLPQVFGDPDIKYVGGCTFIYSSIVVGKFNETSTVQTMGVHRSTDCGHTWQGPFVVSTASNPSGLLTASGAPVDAADKEYLDVDRDSGRVLLSWTNFTSGPSQISTTYTDNILDPVPTWSSRSVVSAGPNQGSIPRFGDDGGAYIAWSESTGGVTNNLGFARSADHGATWSEPVQVSPDAFVTPDLILGDDRIHAFPGLAVDRTHGSHRGNVYVAYASNDALDGSDIVMQRSTDHGATFSSPVVLSSRPGADRSQWFPWTTVDNLTGRVFVFYYDQGVATSGDLTQVTFTFSSDGGATWSQPRPLTQRPFRAGFGNDTGQPNLGDYNQIVAHNGSLFAVWAGTHPVGFTDGEPSSASMTVPEVNFRRVGLFEQLPITSVELGVATVTGGGSDGFLDPGDSARIAVPLTNYVTNPINARSLPFVVTSASSPTPGVRITSGFGLYGALAPGATGASILPIRLQLDPSFVAGTDVELVIVAGSIGGLPTTLHATIHTGTPVETVLVGENFDAAAPGTLPAGWSAIHAGGANVVPWTTSTSFCNSASNAAFHPNAEDGLSGRGTRFERLFSPSFTVPADAGYVTVDFDICYDTEDFGEPFNIYAFDGALLRITDLTPGHVLRSVLAEAFATDFTTGAAFHYPKHFPRSSDSAYFQDMSAWAGDSHGMQHVHLRLPGMAATTAQLRFEFTQDIGGTCADVRPGHTCGVLVDNVVVKSVVAKHAP